MSESQKQTNDRYRKNFNKVFRRPATKTGKGSLEEALKHAKEVVASLDHNDNGSDGWENEGGA